MATILVTGAAGFIGMHTARRLLARGDEVIGIDNLNDYYSPQLKHDRLQTLQSLAGFHFQKIALEDRVAIQTLFRQHQFSSVIHLAAQAGVRYSLQNPRAYADSNLVGFLNILEGCRDAEIGHLTYASSSSVYGANRELPFRVTDRVDHPVSLYAATKKANELMAHSYSHLFGIPTTGLRFFTVYGPWGRPDMALWLFTQAILEDRPIKVFNKGDMKRDFTYIDDIVEGVIRINDQPPAAGSADASQQTAAPYRIYNIGNNQPVPLLTLIQCLEKKLGRSAKMQMLPMQPGDVEATYADIDALRRDAGFSPETSIDDGTQQFVDWFLEQDACQYTPHTD
ncbi:MAG: NAD-dependent epimerase [Planctomycetaceae bacterium]